MRPPVLACLSALVLSAIVLVGRSDALQLPAAGAAIDPNFHENTAHLRRFPTSQLPGAYLLSHWDEYHFAVPYASSAVRFAAYATWKKYGRGLRPMEVWDCSMVDGDTPTGRHPGSAHDGGVNFDITYFMKVSSPEKIVCPDTTDNHCVGPALRMDEVRQAYFYASMAQLDLEMDEELVQLMACDGWVKHDLLPVLDQFAADGTFSSTVIAHTKQLLRGEMVDQGTGWFRFHHDHTHLRFRWQPTVATQMASAVSARAEGVMRGRGLLAMVPPAAPAPKPEPMTPMIAVAPPAAPVAAPVREEEPPVVVKPPVPNVPLVAMVTPPPAKAKPAAALPGGKKPTTASAAAKAKAAAARKAPVKRVASTSRARTSRSRSASAPRRRTMVRRTFASRGRSIRRR